jgi:hypothetical protein
MAPNICGSGFFRSYSTCIRPYLSGVSFSFIYFFTLQEELEEYDVLDQADIGKFSRFCKITFCRFSISKRQSYHRASGSVEKKLRRILDQA